MNLDANGRLFALQSLLFKSRDDQEPAEHKSTEGNAGLDYERDGLVTLNYPTDARPKVGDAAWLKSDTLLTQWMSKYCSKWYLFI